MAKNITTPETTTVSKNKQVNVDGRMAASMNATLNEDGRVSVNACVTEKELYEENSTEVKAAMHSFLDEALDMMEKEPVVTGEAVE